MPITLDDTELRVLGVLIEKSLTQAGTYPLTLNAVILGANQKQNRDPVVEFGEPDVGRALHMLQLKSLVKHAAPSFGARANRFAHNVVEHLHWDRREQAVMAELMLRGRQTAGELRTRASRMAPIRDLPAVHAVLAALAAYETPFVEELSREPGRSTTRFRHLLGGDPADSETAAEVAEPAGVIADPAAAITLDPRPSAESQFAAPKDRSIEATSNELSARVAALEAKVVELFRIVDSLRH